MVGEICSTWRFSSIRLLVIAVVWGGLGIGTAHPQESNDTRSPVPVGDAFEQARTLVQDVYGKEYEKAKTTAQKRALAKTVLEGAQGPEDAANRYVMLRTARNIAAQAGDAELAMQAADEIALRYQLAPQADAHAVAILEMKLETLTRAARGATLSEQHEGVVREARRVQDEAVRGDRFTLALKLGECAVAAARRARDVDLVKEVSAWNQQVEQLAAAAAEVQQALARLEDDPIDPEANLLAGRYYGLYKGDWKQALPMLALGADEKLKELALKEMEGIDDPEEQADVGDAWWELGRATDGIRRKHLMRKAYGWYQTALPKLTGLSETKAKKRMQEIDVDVAVVAEIPGESDSPPPDPTTAIGKKVKFPVELGLKWLAANQLNSGGWSFSTGPNPGSYDQCAAASTSMALIPLLRGGSTHKKGEYRVAVSKGLAFLATRVKVGSAGGHFVEPEGKFYSHGLTTIALCEAYARSKDKRLARAAQLAINYTVYAQDPVGGGWRYTARQTGDTSVTGWQFAGLTIGANAGLKVPRQTMAGVTKFLDGVGANKMTQYGYTGPATGRQATTAIGLLCRMELGWEKKHPALQQGVRYIVSTGPSKTNFYYNYYASALMARYGDDKCRKWCDTLSDYLIASQYKGASLAGSWHVSGSDHGASRGGRLYCTSMALMTLQNCAQCPD